MAKTTSFAANPCGSSVQIYDALTGQNLFTLHLKGPSSGFFISGFTATASYNDGSSQVWDLRTGSMIRTLGSSRGDGQNSAAARALQRGR